MQLQNIRRALVGLLWVLGTFAVYSMTVVPFVEPSRADDVQSADGQQSLASCSTDRYVRELQSLFPAGSWELDQPMVLRIAHV